MTQTLSTQVATNVRAEMARRRLPQARLAQSLGLSQAAVSRRLCGHTAFELDELTIVAAVLGIDVQALVTDAA